MPPLSGIASELTICHVNTQSLVAHLDEFKLYFSTNPYHIICLSETWLTELISDSYISLPGYTYVRCDRIGKREGGVGAYVHLSLQVNVLSTSGGVYDNKPEFLFFEVTCSYASKLLVGVVYRPPKTGFWEDFEDCFHRFYPVYKHTIIMGDFNTNLLANTFDRQHLLEFVRLSCLHIVPFDATHHTATSHTLLDLCIVDDEDKIVSSHQKPVPFLSGHDLISVTYRFKVMVSAASPTFSRDYRGFVEADFLNDLEAMDWTPFYDEPCIDKKLEILNSHIIRTFDIHAPVRCRKTSRPSAPWLNDSVRLAFRKRDKLRLRFRRSHLAEHWEAFKKARNLAKRKARDAKRQYYYTYFNKLHSPSELWAKLRQLGLIKHRQSQLPPHIDLDKLNEWFAAASLADVEITAQVELSVPTKNYSDDLFYFKDISPVMLCDSLRSLHSNAKGVDDITASMIKLSLPIIFPMLLHLFNYSLNTSQFPSLWKSALVRPIPKCKTPAQPADFRPISILSALSKPLERIVSAQLQSYLEKGNLMDPYQSAYRSDYSTQSALIRITDDIRKAIDNRKITIMVLFDFSKAFDRVQHSTLIQKLDKLKLSTSALKWFASYISGHNQAVLGNEQDVISTWLPLSAGVPQGSILGPLLFSTYVNDLRSAIHCSYNFYADDLQIYTEGYPDQIAEAVDRLNVDIDNICNWAISNGLSLNSNKTKAIIFGSSYFVNNVNQDTLPALKVKSVAVPYTSSITLLGVTLTPTLKWTNHCINVVSKINRQLYLLRLNRDLLTFNLRQKLVSTLIFPLIDYCCAIFTDITSEANTILQKAMNNAVRFVVGLRKYEHVTASYYRLGWLKVHARREYFLCAVTYNILKNRRPGYLHERFKPAIRSTALTTRSNFKPLLVPQCRTSTWQRSFLVTTTYLWNGLPEAVRNITTPQSFKETVYRHLASKPIQGLGVQ